MFTTVAAGGIAAVIGATALPDGSIHLPVLMWTGITAMMVGFGGLVGLLLIRPKRKERAMTDEPEKFYPFIIEGEDNRADNNTVHTSGPAFKVGGKRNTLSRNKVFVYPPEKPGKSDEKA